MKQTNKLTREQRAELHWSTRGQWIRVVLPRTQKGVWGIPSISELGKYHLCDGDGCTCADFRFRGLSGLRIGRGGAHLPCSHMLAVRRLESGQWKGSGVDANEGPERHQHQSSQ